MPEAIALEENPDILRGMGESKTNSQCLVGFALETDDGLDSAKAKLVRKNLDAIVLNTLKDDGAGFAVDTNKVPCSMPVDKRWGWICKRKTNLPKNSLTFGVQL